MIQPRWIKIGAKTAFCLSLAIGARALGADDTARFKGNWKTSFPANGQTETIESVHDDTGVKNYIVLPTTLARFADGQFTAVDGKWTLTSGAIKSSGTYQFTDENTAVCTDAATGVTLVWKRDFAPLKPVINPVPPPPPGGVALPAATNVTAVKTSQAIEIGRKMAKAWHPDAILFVVRVLYPSPDGTANLTAVPTAFGMLFYSPSTNACLGVGSGPSAKFYAGPYALPDGAVLRAIPPQALDLTDAYAAAKTCGFSGGATTVVMSFSNEHDKPVRLVWVMDTGEMYPRVVSAASGAVLSPFQVVDDKAADYNQLVADTQAAVQQYESRHRGHSPFAAAGLHFYAAESREGGSENHSNGAPDEADTWDNDVAAQNAWDQGDSDAEARFDAGTPTETDQVNYGGGD
jgi:hypothetical protein